MFKFLTKKYSVQTNTKLVRDAETLANDPTGAIFDAVDPLLGPELAAEYAGIAKDFLTHAAVVFTSAYVVCKIAKKVCA